MLVYGEHPALSLIHTTSPPSHTHTPASMMHLGPTNESSLSFDPGIFLPQSSLQFCSCSTLIQTLRIKMVLTYSHLNLQLHWLRVYFMQKVRGESVVGYVSIKLYFMVHCLPWNVTLWQTWNDLVSWCYSSIIFTLFEQRTLLTVWLSLRKITERLIEDVSPEKGPVGQSVTKELDLITAPDWTILTTI